MYETSQSGYITRRGFGNRFNEELTEEFNGRFNGLESITQSYQSTFNYQPQLTHQSQIFYSVSEAIPPSYNIASFVSSNLVSSNRFSGLDVLPQTYSHQENKYSLFTIKPEYHFIPNNFLKPEKNSMFIGKAEEIRADVEEAFEKIFNRSFPDDVKISILDQKKFNKLTFSHQAIGLSINRSEQGLLSEIFVLNGSLGKVMLTIGHELGHVLTPTLDNAHDEEAKAYAFSLIWMKVIKEYNLANLADTIITETPAFNGLHNISFKFVQDLIFQGRKEAEIYNELITKEISLLF